MAEAKEPCMDGTGVATARSHVHFPQEQLPEHTSDIVIKPNDRGELEIHLGFLQVHHTYKISFSIQDSLGDTAKIDPLKNVNARVTSLVQSSDGKGHDIEVSFNAYKEKLLNERVTLYNDNNQKLVLMLFARVLGKGKGKPSLRTNIHCLATGPTDDSDQTDFNGFGES